MVQNFPGPYELRFSYSTDIGGPLLHHTERLNLDLTAAPSPGDAFNNINAKTRGGINTPDLAAVVEAWLLLIKVRFHTSTDFGVVELWSYVPLTFDAEFVSAYNPVTTLTGSSVSPTVTASQEIYTFRTTEGGNMRIVFIETTAGATQPTPAPTVISGVPPIFAFVTSTDNWILGRDTSYPFASLKFLGGQNEKTFRQRWR